MVAIVIGNLLGLYCYIFGYIFFFDPCSAIYIRPNVKINQILNKIERVNSICVLLKQHQGLNTARGCNDDSVSSAHGFLHGFPSILSPSFRLSFSISNLKVKE